MAAKKKKTVTIEVDVDTLIRLTDAVEALSELASAHIQGVHDPAVRAKLTKGKGKKGK